MLSHYLALHAKELRWHVRMDPLIEVRIPGATAEVMYGLQTFHDCHTLVIF